MAVIQVIICKLLAWLGAAWIVILLIKAIAARLGKCEDGTREPERWEEGTAGESMVFRPNREPLLVFYGPPEHAAPPGRKRATKAVLALFSDGRIWIKGKYYRLIEEESQ